MRNLRIRKNIRIQGYDYTTRGAYFVTICTKNREEIFGEIKNGNMEPNLECRIVEKWWNDFPNHLLGTEIDEYIIMPNHFHGIVWLVGAGEPRPYD